MQPKGCLDGSKRKMRSPLRLDPALLLLGLVGAGSSWASLVADGASLSMGRLGPVGSSTDSADQGPSLSGFSIRAEAFKPGADIPRKFSCQGSDASPALAWTDPPAGTQSLVLIVDDPDAPAGTWVHWVLYDLPPSVRRLAEALPPTAEVTGGGRQGANDFGKTGYGGPCPPPGKPHRYFFKLYALDTRLNLKAGVTKSDVEQAMKGHVLAKAEMVGRYRQ
jgi:Raf kinase inhibitor-like YbhB/YbcL family protein